MVLENLEPKSVWDIFENIVAATPRESKKEDRIRKVITEWVSEKSRARSLNTILVEDEAGNILIKIPASPSMEHCPAIMLQGHMDMVCETDREEGFDFEQNPIPVRIQENGKWVDADGTTLGADNGIAIAMALALLEEDFEHGPVEILLTVDEETGLTGAFALDAKEMGIESKYLLNLDSEDIGVITIGSAGGGEVSLERKVSFSPPNKDMFYFRLSVSGLQGGHSGVNIHLHRANANKLAGRLLRAVLEQTAVYLSSWNGGSKHNAITRDAEVLFGVPEEEKTAVFAILEKHRDSIVSYYTEGDKEGNSLEPDITIEWTQIGPKPHIGKDESAEIIRTVMATPHGPKNYSPQVPELVETSCNLAVIQTTNDSMSVLISARGNIDSELEAFRHALADIGLLGGWGVRLSPSYPGWKPQPNSPFLGFVKRHYQKFVDKDVVVEAVHAGLECGIIGSQVEGMQMVSIGPTIKNAHTPDEKLLIEDVSTIYNLLKEILGDACSLQ